MASVARAIEQAASCTLDANLWWDSHESLFESLDHFLSSAGKLPLNPLAESLQANHSWLLETLLQFRLPNAKSRAALDVARVVIGGHTLEIKSDLKHVALQISKQLVLDEVQSYILVSRCFNGDQAPSATSDSFQNITLKYYTERQCLLKCVRLLLLSHMAEPSCNSDTEALDMEVKALVNEGLDEKMFRLLDKLLTIDQPLDLDLMLISFWAEQVVVEEHFVMDIIFLLYFDPLCTCSFMRWKELFVMFNEKILVGTSVERLSLTAEAMALIEHLKHQSVLILLETLDLDKLLLMVYDDVPFSQDRHPFSALELQQVDRMLGGLKALEVQEYGPLLLGWGTFLCLVSFLPTPQAGALDFNHTTYIQQAHEGEAFTYLHNMLCHKSMQETNIDGYKCVIKSTISTFIAAFDIVSQNDTATMEIIIDILYLIYSGQEVLCAEFWDRENILDSPLRNLLYSLREYFPHQMKPLVQLLAGLAEGAWPAECVYDFLYRPSEVTCRHQGEKVVANSGTFITAKTIPLPGVPGLFIPAGTAGQCVKVLEDKTNVVLWKCKHSAIVLLLLHLQKLACAGKSWTDAHAIANLLQRMLFSNKTLAGVLLELNNADVCEHAHADGRMDLTARVEILAVMRMLLGTLLDVPDYSATAAICTNIFGVYADCCTYMVMLELGMSRSSWSSSNSQEEGLLTKLLASICKDSERSKGKHQLVISVLDLCKSLVSKGAHSESLCELVAHAIGTLFLNHMTWKYEQKYERWKITAKVFELAHSVVLNSNTSLTLLKARVLNVIVMDPAFHSALIRILSVSMADLQGLYFNRFAELKDIEWFEAAITEGFLLLHEALSTFFASVPFDDSRSSSPLEHALLHHAVGTMPFVECVISLTGYSQNQALQLASIKMLTIICVVAGRAKPHPVSISSYIQGSEQKQSLGMVFAKLISKDSADSNEELFNFSTGLVITATKHQPSFVQTILSPIKEIRRVVDHAKEGKHQNIFPNNVRDTGPGSTVDDCIWNILKQPSLFESRPQILSRILLILRSLWEGGSEFLEILESFRQRDGFWPVLTSYISNISSVFEGTDELLPQSFQSCCQAHVLQIVVWELFLQKHKGFEQSNNYNGGHIQTHGSKQAVSLAVVQLLQATDPAKLIQSFAVSHYQKAVVVRAKAEMRILLVGLMLKMLMEDTLGLSVVICDFLRDSLKAVLNHSSFQKLSSTYSSQGYGHGKQLYGLVVSDLYFHLQGELEAGRHIPAGSFEDLMHFLDTMDLTAILNTSKETSIEGVQCDEGFSYDVRLFRQHVGLEWWSETTGHILETAENTLNAMQQATMMAFFGRSQVSALEALTSLFSFFATTKELVAPGLMLNWKDVCILEVCSSLQSSLNLLGPDGDPTQHVQSFISMQLRLLLVLLQWFLVSPKDENSKRVNKICSKVVSTLVKAVKPILTSCLTVQAIQQQITRSLLGAFLVSLELLQTQYDASALQAEAKLPSEQGSTTISNATFECAEFLPFVCSLIEIKCHASLAASVVCILLKHFLAPQIWLPILQMHSTVGVSLSLLHVAEDTEGAFQILNLLLSLSHVRSGVEMLQSAGIFSHILVFTEKMKEELLNGERDGPFCVWRARTRRHELWGLSVAIVAAIVNALGENNRDNAIESAFIFLQSQKELMLQALQSPGSSNKDGNKRTRFGHSETAISALQETQQVLHLMIVLVKHHAQWFRVMGESEEDFRRKCIHLLAYIAREGLLHNVSSNAKTSFHCYPVTKEDVSAHRIPSMLNASAGWFGLAAKGAAATSKIDTFGLSQVKQSSLQLEAHGTAPTAYSDSVALHVYKISLLLLELFCKQAQLAVTVLNEGGTLMSHTVPPEFPAPEILYGMQDQVMSIVTNISGRQSTTPLQKEARQTCCVLLSILEKTLFLEASVSRICGIAPLSVRAEDFLRDYKALLSACEGHQCLDAPLKAIKPVVSLAYTVPS